MHLSRRRPTQRSGTGPAIASRLARDRECIQRAKDLWSTEEVEENSFDLTLGGAELAPDSPCWNSISKYLQHGTLSRARLPHQTQKELCHMGHRTSLGRMHANNEPLPQSCPLLPVTPRRTDDGSSLAARDSGPRCSVCSLSLQSTWAILSRLKLDQQQEQLSGIWMTGNFLQVAGLGSRARSHFACFVSRGLCPTEIGILCTARCTPTAGRPGS